MCSIKGLRASFAPEFTSIPVPEKRCTPHVNREHQGIKTPPLPGTEQPRSECYRRQHRCLGDTQSCSAGTQPTTRREDNLQERRPLSPFRSQSLRGYFKAPKEQKTQSKAGADPNNNERKEQERAPCEGSAGSGDTCQQWPCWEPAAGQGRDPP